MLKILGGSGKNGYSKDDVDLVNDKGSLSPTPKKGKAPRRNSLGGARKVIGKLSSPGLDGSQHSKRASGSKSPGLDSSQHSVKQRRSKKGRNSDMDGSNHSVKSASSAVSKRRSKKKSSDLDGSNHSVKSTGSTRSKKKGTANTKKLRGGKRQSSMPDGGATPLHDDASMSSLSNAPKSPQKSVREKRSQVGQRKPKTAADMKKNKSVGDLEDHSNGEVQSAWDLFVSAQTKEQEEKAKKQKQMKKSLGDHLHDEMKSVLDDDTAFGPQTFSSSKHSKDTDDNGSAADAVPALPKRTNSFTPAKIMSQESALFHDLWKNPDMSFSSLLGGQVKTSVLKQKREAKEIEDELCKRLAESEEREKALMEESKQVRDAYEELVNHVEDIERRLDDEIEKNTNLRRSLINKQKKQTPDDAFGRAVSDALHRQVDALTEEVEIMRTKLHNREEQSTASGAASFSGADSDEEVSLIKTQLVDRDAVIASQNRELENMRKMMLDMAKGGDMSSNPALEGFKAELNDAKNQELQEQLKGKDETIQYLMAEVAKLKMAQPSPNNGGGSSLFGSVFNSPLMS